MTSRDVYFFGNACAFSSRKAVSVPSSVIGGLGAPWRPAILLGVCVSSWHMWTGWADVGLWVAVCFLAKMSLHRSTCKTTFARLTQSQAISQSFRVFISFRSMRDTTFFSFYETLFNTKLPFPLPWWSKDLLVDLAGGGQSTSKSTCEVPAWTLTAFGDRSASSMSK